MTTTFRTRLLISACLVSSGCNGSDRCAPPPKAPAVAVAREFERVLVLDEALARIEFRERKARENLSDVAVLSTGLLAVVSDEGTQLGVVDVEHKDARVFEVSPWLGLDADAVKEIDLEGIATIADRLVVCGSSSLKRKKPRAGEDNVRRMAEVEPASGPGSDASDQVLVLRISGSDLGSLTLTPVEHWNLREKLLTLALLAPFRELPSKDNGLDVEAVAAADDHLYFGLRGPVLRGHALVLRTDWHGGDPVLSFLQLSGLGVRGLLREPNGRGLYVLAGPTMELDGPVVIYAWNGRSSMFGAPEEPGLARLLSVPTGPAAHPEGVFMWRNSLCVLSDGPVAGFPRCFVGPLAL